MAEFWTNYAWPLIVIVARACFCSSSCLHRPRAARRPQDLGGGADPARPDVVGPWGLHNPSPISSSSCSRADHPSGANKGVFLLAPLVTGVLALRLGGDPVNANG
jgi:hypothetical protein